MPTRYQEKQWVLRESGLLDGEAPAFAAQITEIAKTKLNRQLYTGKIESYGTVLFPKR